MLSTKPSNSAVAANASTDKRPRPILCMEHCRDHQIFGFDIPNRCTHCGTDLMLASAEFHIPPFRIPSPFSNAIEHPCAIVLKPTNGTFLSDYKPGDDLHIGVTSSLGAVYEYSRDGLRNGTAHDWTQCICIPVKHIFKSAGRSQSHESLIRNHWDAVLFQITATATASASVSTNEWSKESYNEWTHNCYSFVLQFLQTLYHRLGSGSLSIPLCINFESISTTERFCEEFILEKTKSAGKYIALHRQLQLVSDVCTNAHSP